MSSNKMLIDAAHPEETRVVVVRGGTNRIEEFDFESANRKQLRGNIYLAKVTRVEPSLQAAFVEYGGNRHGFLAFSEIHPDYYQIPVADRQALLDEEERDTRADDADDEEKKDSGKGRRRRGRGKAKDAPKDESVSEDAPASDENEAEDEAEDGEDEADDNDGETGDGETGDGETGGSEAGETERDALEAAADQAAFPEVVEPGSEPSSPGDVVEVRDEAKDEIESVGAESNVEEEMPQRREPRRMRHYKIQEVIKRRQVLLVQAVKEERGNKGAALTTYLSLAGRYSVLMPNTARGGGISRKVTNATDRKKMKEIAGDLEVPEGMGVILRTAGASRTKAEVKRDFEYLLRLWETVREKTLESTAPALVHEEGSLVKRAIRDLYNKDIDEVLVSGDGSFKEAKDFMRMLIPSHAKNVKLYREQVPIFTKFGVDSQLDAMFSNVVTLKSGGYIVINQTEALVAVDVNSGRATREHNIEDTAVKTNLEAAEEVSRQLRLRDLAGLIVVDFIDMEENRNNRAVEKKLKDCLKHDRARIQVGRISHFGLLEMSRQRIRTGVLESSSDVCPVCAGSGRVRSVPSVALHVLRIIEENLLRSSGYNLNVRTTNAVALYILNQKRGHLRDIETRFGVEITFTSDEHLAVGEHCVIQRGEPSTGTPLAPQLPPPVIDDVDDTDLAEDDESGEQTDREQTGREQSGREEGGAQPQAREPRPQGGGRPEQADQGEGEGGRRRRRRRRRGRGRGGEGRGENGEGRPENGESRPASFTGEGSEGVSEDGISEDGAYEGGVIEADEASATAAIMTDKPEVTAPDAAEAAGEERRPRRRGRRGGRKGRGEGDAAGDEAPQSEADTMPGDAEPVAAPAAEEPAPVAVERAEPAPEPEAKAEPKPKRSRAPVESTPAPAVEDRPRRSGWWNKMRGG
jgi:ribonuclease E